MIFMSQEKKGDNKMIRKKKTFRFKFNLGGGIFFKLVTAFLTVTIVTLVVINLISTQIVNSEIKKQFISSTDQLLNQNKTYVDYIMNSINNYSMQLGSDNDFSQNINNKDLEAHSKASMIQVIVGKFNNIMISNQFIESIQLVSLKGTSIMNPGGVIDKEVVQKVNAMDFYKKALKLEGKNFFIAPHKDEINQYGNIIMSDVRLLKNGSSGDVLGALLINIKPDTIKKSISTVGKLLKIMSPTGAPVSRPT